MCRSASGHPEGPVSPRYRFCVWFFPGWFPARRDCQSGALDSALSFRHSPRPPRRHHECELVSRQRYLLIGGGNFNNTLTLLDSTDGSSRVIYRGTDTFQAAVSPDGKKIAYSGGAAEWDILGVSLPEGRVRTLVGGGGVSWQPDWAPSGTHFLYGTFVTGAVPGIEDRYATEGFSRRVAKCSAGYEYLCQWAALVSGRHTIPVCARPCGPPATDDCERIRRELDADRGVRSRAPPRLVS